MKIYLNRGLAALVFLILFQKSYSEFLNPVFDYAGYRYHDRQLWVYIFAYAAALLPVVVCGRKFTPVNFGASLLYVTCFAPGILTMVFMWEKEIQELIFAIVLLSLAMAFLFFAGRNSVQMRNASKISMQSNLHVSKKSSSAILILTMMSVGVLLATNWSHMRLVGFENVYDLRFDSRDASSSIIGGYFMLWLSTLLIPYYSTVGVVGKNWKLFVFAVLLSLLVYMANGAKSTILMPFIIAAFSYLIKEKEDVLLRIILVFSILLFVMLFLDNYEFLILKSLIILRTLSTGGYTLTLYYEYFSQYYYTFYSHIGIVNFITNYYPYEYSLGQMIGIEYFNTEDANYNANFWASDGFAAAGLLGLIPATLACYIVFRAINHISIKFDSKFVSLWLTGFWLSILNAPLSTSLLSGGGLFVMIFLWVSRRKVLGRVSQI